MNSFIPPRILINSPRTVFEFDPEAPARFGKNIESIKDARMLERLTSSSLFVRTFPCFAQSCKRFRGIDLGDSPDLEFGALAEDLFGHIEERFAMRTLSRLIAKEGALGKGEDDLLFVNDDGLRLAKNRAKHAGMVALEPIHDFLVGLKRAPPHARHTAALEAALARRLHTWRRNGRRGLGANGAIGSFALRVGFMIRWSLGRRRPGWAALTLSGDAL